MDYKKVQETLEGVQSGKVEMTPELAKAIQEGLQADRSSLNKEAQLQRESKEGETKQLQELQGNFGKLVEYLGLEKGSNIDEQLKKQNELKQAKANENKTEAEKVQDQILDLTSKLESITLEKTELANGIKAEKREAGKAKALQAIMQAMTDNKGIESPFLRNSVANDILSKGAFDDNHNFSIDNLGPAEYTKQLITNDTSLQQSTIAPQPPSDDSNSYSSMFAGKGSVESKATDMLKAGYQ